MTERKSEGRKSPQSGISEGSVSYGSKIVKYMAMCSAFFLLIPSVPFFAKKAGKLTSRMEIKVTLNNPPSTPVLLSPKNNDNVVISEKDISKWSLFGTKQIVFKWKFSDPDLGQEQKSFNVEIDDDKNFKSVNFTSGDVNSSENRWECKSKIPEGTWYWRVRTGDEYNALSEFSNCRVLNIKKK